MSFSKLEISIVILHLKRSCCNICLFFYFNLNGIQLGELIFISLFCLINKLDKIKLQL
jgi:hypothetical protein